MTPITQPIPTIGWHATGADHSQAAQRVAARRLNAVIARRTNLTLTAILATSVGALGAWLA